MKNYTIATRYARGLSEGIADLKELEVNARALGALGALYRDSRPLQNALSTPAVRMEKRQRILDEVLAATEAPERVRGFLRLLLRRGRIAHLPDVVEVFDTLADERLNRLHAEITTAFPLSTEQEERLRTAFERFTARQVRIEAHVDNGILGGVVAKLGSVVIDGSILSRLKRLRAALLTEEHAQ